MKQLVKSTIKKSFGAAGLELRRKSEPVNQFEFEEGSLLVPKVWDKPFFHELISLRLSSTQQLILLLGSSHQIEFLRAGFAKQHKTTECIEWDWQSDVDLSRFPGESPIIVCKLPRTEEQWRIMKRLRESYGARVMGIQELVLPLTTIQQGQACLTSSVNTMEELTRYYVGEEFYGPLDRLNAIFPLAGKSVIEFGPMEGSQTAGLVKFGRRNRNLHRGSRRKLYQDHDRPVRDDLINFFQNRDYDIAIITDEKTTDPWGDWYLRFLATKRSA